MHIKQCIVSKTGQFKNKLIEFSDKINIVYGANDSGKTYLTRAIGDILWGIVSKDSFLPSQSWEDLFLSLVVDFNGSLIEYERNANSNFNIISKDDCKVIFTTKNLENIDNNSTFRNSIKDKDTLKRYYSTINKDFFECLGFLSSLIESKEANINPTVLKNFLIMDSSEYSLLFNKLNDHFFSNDKNKEFIKILNLKILSYEADIKNLEKEIKLNDLKNSKKSKLVNEKLKTLEEINKINSEIDSIRLKISNIQSINIEIEDLKKITEKINELNATLNNEKEKEDNLKQIKEEIKAKYPQFISFTSNQKNNLEKIQHSFRKIKELNEDLSNLNHENELNKSKFLKNIILSSFLAGSLTLYVKNDTLKLLTGLNNKFFYTGISSFFIFSLIIFIIKFFLKNKNSKIITTTQKLENAKKYLSNTLKENNININHDNIDETYEFLVQYFEEYGFFSSHENEIDYIKTEIKDKSFFKEIKSQLKNLNIDKDKKINHIQHLLKEIDLNLNAAEVSNDFILNYTNDLTLKKSDLDEKLSLNKALLEKIKLELDKIKNFPENDNNINEEIEKLDNKKNQLLTLSKNIEIVNETMKEAVEKRTSDQMGKLKSLTFKYFNNLTQNRYITNFADQDFNEILINNEIFKNPSIAHNFLLSLKIALTDFMIENRVILPLIVDEPTAYMDNQRLNVFKKIIEKISESRQVIILTHSNSLNDFGQLIEL